MDKPLTVGSAEYHEMLRRCNDLADKYGVDMTHAEYEEMLSINMQLESALMDFDQREAERQDEIAVSQTPFAMIAEDFEQQMRIGDYGGCEL